MMRALIAGKREVKLFGTELMLDTGKMYGRGHTAGTSVGPSREADHVSKD